MSYISAATLKDNVIVWERDDGGDRRTVLHSPDYYFYVDDPNGKYQTIYDTPVTKVKAKSSFDMRSKKEAFERAGIRVWETDISPEIRILSSLYYGKPAPKLNITFLDIEVDYDKTIGFAGVYNPYAPINSISIFHYNTNELFVFCVPPDDTWTDERMSVEVNSVVPVPSEYKTKIVLCANERQLLELMLEQLGPSDIVCGWNSEFFDFPYIFRRIEITLGKSSISKLSFPRAKVMTLQEKEVPRFGKDVKTLKLDVVNAGRMYADYMELYRKYEFGERSSYKLEAISDIVLVDEETGESLLPKLHYEKSLYDLYREDFAYFVRYNIRDTEILKGFEDTLAYVELSNQMYHLSTALYQHVSGTLKLAEFAIVNHCHHNLKRVVPNSKMPEVDKQIDGAYVLLPQIGQHERIGSIDINSLYPSSIRSINISPETLRGQFTTDKAAALAIATKENVKLTLELEDGTVFIKSALEWRDWLSERKWAISGYGTVFEQHKQGIIPAILTEWYATRKKYQKLKGEASAAGNKELVSYYDRLQYVYKIKLNSLYGALTNLYFRFYDLRMGESTTGTGRMILKHQCRMVSKVLDGKYDVDFPMYDTIEDAMEAGYTEFEANLIALRGTFFNGQFQSESVIYGDTDSTYFITHTDDDATAIMIADAVADKVNKAYPEFMRDAFLCTEGFDDIIKCGREIVSDHGIFVDKKRYILHLIDLDGDKVDKMKIMGLDTKKTTLPAAVSNKLNGFIERLLKGATWEDVSQDIVDYKDQLRNSENIMDIGLPKGVKNVDKYTNEYRLTGDKTRLPGHVAATIYYNICLEKYGDKDSTPISSGMKIKVFYLKGNHGKFKSIAIPTDNEHVPPWFEEFKIDMDAHILRLVDNPLDNIVKAIGKQVPTKHSLKVQTAWVF